MVRERAISKIYNVIEEDDTSFNTPKMKYTGVLSYGKSESEVLVALKRSTTCFSGTKSGPRLLP